MATSFGDSFRTSALQSTTDVLGGIQANGLDFLKMGPSDTSFRQGIETPISLLYTNTNRTYNGTDCTIAVIYNENIVILGNVETISYSIHRDKMPVRTLGRTYAKNYVRGQRTIAGSLIFIQFDESPLYKLYDFFNKKLENSHRYSSPLVDELPPFDVMLIFTNEYGFTSIIRIYGVEITDEGGTYSINDIYSENVMQFLAKDIDPMVSNGSQGKYQNMLFQKMLQGKIADELYISMLKNLQRLEKQLADLDVEMSKIRNSANNLKFDKNGDEKVYRTDYMNIKQANRHNDREMFNSLSDSRKKLMEEIKISQERIEIYQKTKMTWDMNSALQKEYVNNAVFAKDSKDTGKPSETKTTSESNSDKK